MPINYFREFLRLESASGILLLAALVLVLAVANSPLNVYYQQFIHVPLYIGVGPFSLH